MRLTVSTESLFIIRKSGIAYALMLLGMLIAVWGSMQVWFMWPLGLFYTIVADLFLVLSWLISRNYGTPIYKVTHLQIVTLCFFAFQLYEIIVNGKNMNAFVMSLFDTGVIMALTALTPEVRQRVARHLSITVGGIMVFSIVAYILYLLDFPMPNVTVSTDNGVYTFSNYYFFLVDAGSSFIYPRFRGIYLEPGHVGTICALLLYTQTGSWKRWYNVAMIIGLIMSFSLAAYVIFVMVIFAGMWMKGKHIMPKIIAAIAVIGAIGVGAYFYNGGHNLLNQLILARLEVNANGRLAGDNRVTESFESEYDDFMKSDDLLTGRDFTVEKYGPGNSGYRVFVFNYGLLGVLIAAVFYLLIPIDAKNKRAVLSMWAITAALFWERATPMAYYNVIPLLIASYWQSSTPVSGNQPHDNPDETV